jgi:hypothetical protein
MPCHFEPLWSCGGRVVPSKTRRPSKSRISKKYHHTDATAFVQYPHQTTSGRRELAASQDINNTRPASHLQEQRSPKPTEVACSGPELTSHAPHGGPAVQDFQHRRHPSSPPSSPKSSSTLPYHASSSPPRKLAFAIDLDGGKAPKTLTRNKIQIPPRTRYAPLSAIEYFNF